MGITTWLAALLQPLLFVMVYMSTHVGSFAPALAEYGALGAMVAAEMIAIVWLARKLVGYMETTAIKSTAASERVADLLGTLVRKAEDRDELREEQAQEMARLLERLSGIVSNSSIVRDRRDW